MARIPGSTLAWQDNRLYFTRPTSRRRTHALWSIAVDGTGERRVADLRSFRTIDVFFDVSRHGHLAWAPLRTGDHQLWTAQLK